MRSCVLLPCILGVAYCAGGVQLYSLDTTFKPQFPAGSHTISAVGIGYSDDGTKTIFVTQRGNASVAPVLVLNADGTFRYGFGESDIGLDSSVTPANPTWGSHGIFVQTCLPGADPFTSTTIWVDDFTNHAVTAFNALGDKLLQLGRPSDTYQFGSVADSAVQPGITPGTAMVFSSDGDGGTANRVEAIEVDYSSNTTTLKWATPAIFKNPHSIALHGSSGLLIVANREGNETRLLRSSDGKDLGAWSCGIEYGAEGKPFGVRFYNGLLFVAIMDDPQTGRNQKIAVIDAQHLNTQEGAQSKCEVLQMVTVPAQFSGPHLLGVDPKNGDVYAALVSDKPDSTVLRFTCTGCN